MFSRISSVILFAAAMLAPISRTDVHPKLISAAPAVNGHVASAPSMLTLTFNEPITAALSAVSLLDAAQREVTLETVRSAAKDRATLVAKVTGAMAPGRYTVRWRAAGKDGHPIKGEFTFVVDAAQ